MIPFRLIALGLTVVITVGFAIYRHYNSEQPGQPQQYSYGPSRTDDNDYTPSPASSSSNAIPRKRGKALTSSNCSICLQYVVTTDVGTSNLKCGHSFHTRCIEVWFNNRKTCPNCRAQV